MAIIYISHRLQELRQIADKVTVLRDGRHIGTVAMGETSTENIVQMMFGEATASLAVAVAAEGYLVKTPQSAPLPDQQTTLFLRKMLLRMER